ncbi:hypothetical protein GFPCMMHI_04949 [Ensifer adhaerens]|nr:hypothetical protein [Ensifer adhaerens]
MTTAAQQNDCDGFTLLEVLVAFVILTLFLSVAFAGFSTSLRAERRAEIAQQAMQLAQAKMDAIGITEPIPAAKTTGSFGSDFSWTASVQALRPQAASGLRGYWIEIAVIPTVASNAQLSAPIVLKTVKLVAGDVHE